MSNRQRYRSVPLRAQKGRPSTSDVAARQTQRYVQPSSAQRPRQSHTSAWDMPYMPDDNELYTLPGIPRSARRYITPEGDEVYRDGSKQLIVSYRQPPRRIHWLLYIGLGMLAMWLVWTVFVLAGNWWNRHQLDAQYGYPRTWQSDEYVEHGDSPAHPNHFIFTNLHGRVIVMEITATDNATAHIYSGPTIFGDNADNWPVTAEFRDINGDGKVDMLVHFSSQTLVYLNDGHQFKLQQ